MTISIQPLPATRGFSTLAFSAAFARNVLSGRGLFDASGHALTFTPGSGTTIKGNTLLAFIAHNAADLISEAPAGWQLIITLGSGDDTLDVYAHMVGDNEPTSIVFSLASNASEWQGELVVLTGTSPSILVETVATAAFSTTTSLTTAGVISQQAINLILAVWTCSGSPVLSPPTGFTLVDKFATSIVSSRSMLVAYQLAGATGALTFLDATAGTNTTGRSFTFALRGRIPIAPSALVDHVPGNIGLIGKDTRPAR